MRRRTFIAASVGSVMAGLAGWKFLPSDARAATGDSPPELASVTVVAPSGALADGLSTALFVMGSEKALRLVSQLREVDVLLVDKAGKIWKTPGLPGLRT